MDKALSNECVALLANSIKDCFLEDVAKIADSLASTYGEPTRERLVSALIANIHAQA